MKQSKEFLEYTAYQIKISSLIMTTLAQSGHATSCLSGAEIITALFFHAMRFYPDNFAYPNNDCFVLSKGHAAPLLYAVYKELELLSQDELLTYRQFTSPLEGHPTMRFEYTQAATGSLGIGLSIGSGMALAAKKNAYDYHTYVLMGDGETSEGSVWEAAELASHYKLDNLIGIVDCNRLGQSDESLHGHHLQRYADKFHSFGWKTIIVDGHSLAHITGALDKARDNTDQPTVILAKTLKGNGVDIFENKEGFHGKPLKKEEINEALAQLEKRHEDVTHYTPDGTWKPIKPTTITPKAAPCISLDAPAYAPGELIATRKAYGHALTTLGRICKTVVVLDAEVKNSTFAELFEKSFPDRFIQCFIAEQNMISMGVGLDRHNKIPFISTFAAFFTRAFDQIRMGAIGNARLRLAGSHAGVSIGQDGPSQMGLEDIALMSTLPQSIVLYPSDAVSTHHLLGQMATYTDGISYMRTTRMATPVIYENHELFPIGGCKLLKQSDADAACIIAAGITLHEALKAYDILQAKGISASVIDLYSIKPLDTETISACVMQANNRLVTVEDHYLHGGIGQTISYALRNQKSIIECLAVTELPRSGSPEELLAWAGIDAAAIVIAVQKIITQ